MNDNISKLLENIDMTRNIDEQNKLYYEIIDTCRWKIVQNEELKLTEEFQDLMIKTSKNKDLIKISKKITVSSYVYEVIQHDKKFFKCFDINFDKFFYISWSQNGYIDDPLQPKIIFRIDNRQFDMYTQPIDKKFCEKINKKINISASLKEIQDYIKDLIDILVEYY